MLNNTDQKPRHLWERVAYSPLQNFFTGFLKISYLSFISWLGGSGSVNPLARYAPAGQAGFVDFFVIVTGLFYDTMSVKRCVVSRTTTSRLLFCLTLNLTQFCAVDRDIAEFVDTAEPRVAPRSEYTYKLLRELGLFREFVQRVN